MLPSSPPSHTASNGSGGGDEDVCDSEANVWRLCVERHLGNASARALCATHEASFDACIARWRAHVGPDVRIQGDRPGEPAPQCAALSCLVGECLRQSNYDFTRCKPPMACFKHCVKAYYGSEYVT